MTTEPRLAGVVTPMFSLRRENDHGIGDITALREWIDWAADAHVGFLQLLPINALGEEETPSPYSSISSVALEPLYLSLEPWALAGLSDPIKYEADVSRPWQEPSGPNLVDYPKVREWKYSVLRLIWFQFKTRTDNVELKKVFNQWVAEQDEWLEDFASFKILMHLFGTSTWWQWPEQDPTRCRKITEEYEEEKNFQHWLQWLCFRQWEFIQSYASERGVLLMGDIPIGVSMASSDVFFQRHLFDTNWCGGAPAEGNYAADPFTAKWGQNWGIPLYKWDIMSQDDFAWWRRRVRYTVKIFRMYRIDHILGFYRIYAFPWKPTDNDIFLNLTPQEAERITGGKLPDFKPHPDNEQWQRQENLTHGDHYLRILLAAAPQAIVVGEDLGCVPDYVRPDLRQLNIAGFKIPHWEIKEDGNITLGNEYNPCSFAAYSTHDFETMIQTWNTAYNKIQRVKNIGIWNKGECLETNNKDHANLCREAQDAQRLLKWFADYSNMPDDLWQNYWNINIKTALFRALFNSKSDYAALLWTELFDINERLNTPGTVGGTNWRERMPFTAAEATKMPETDWLRVQIDASGRQAPQGEEAISALKSATQKALQDIPVQRPALETYLNNIYGM